MFVAYFLAPGTWKPEGFKDKTKNNNSLIRIKTAKRVNAVDRDDQGSKLRRAHTVKPTLEKVAWCTRDVNGGHFKRSAGSAPMRDF